ncbi:MAG TPA: lysylphosphatidylglycerol synthase domain-containing protein [Baekduia sp.]|nr:lysylphosphatidylglycerol synthase domain-containing protein [Baekduia sp.]
MSDALSPRHLAQRLAQIAAVLAIGGLLLATLPGLGDVRERFSDARPGWVALVLVLEVGSVASFIVVFRGVFCIRMPWGFSAQVGLSEQAANVLLPAGGAGGLALGAWALNRAGMSAGHIARRTVAFFLITSSANFLVAVLAGIGLLTGILPGEAGVALAAVPAGLALAVIAAVFVLPHVLPERPEVEPAEALVGTPRLARLRRAVAHAGATLSEGLLDAGALLRSGRPSVIGGAAGYLLFDMAALTAAFYAFGHAPAPGDFLMAYVLGQLGGLVPLPGGVGGTDGGLVAALALYGTPLASATAAVLAYRAFQLGLPALTGTVAFGRLRKTLQHDARAAAGCEPMAAPVRVIAPAAEPRPREIAA